MTLTRPPIGARVRHTTTYADGTAIIIEGTVSHLNEHGVGIGMPNTVSGKFGFLKDEPGAYTVALEVLDLPVGPEPTDGYFLDRDGDVWWYVDNESGDPPWCSIAARTSWGNLNKMFGPLTRLIPDPADTVDALPWQLAGNGVATVSDSNTPGFVAVSVVNASYGIDDAERIAAAILRGVREARQP